MLSSERGEEKERRGVERLKKRAWKRKREEEESLLRGLKGLAFSSLWDHNVSWAVFDHVHAPVCVCARCLL